MPLKTHLDEQPQLNMTPVIDCVFLLLIFFLVASRLDEVERRIGLKVPEVSDKGALTAAPERKVINVYRDGTITLGRVPVTVEQLTQELAAARSEYSDLGVLVRGDFQGQYQHVAEALNACKQAGIKELGISVRPLTSGD